MKKVCFVCMGNTCRSPMAEKIFNYLCKKYNIKGLKGTSAGIDCCDGQNIEIKTKRALKNLGITCGAKKTCRLQKYEKDTVYIAVTSQIKKALSNLSVLCFADFGGDDIEDPYGGGQDVYNACAAQIYSNVKKIVERILKLSKQ